MPLLFHAVKAAEAQPDHSAVLVQGHASSSLDDGIVGQEPGILASLLNDLRLMLIEEFELLRDRVHPGMLLPGQSLLETMVIGLLGNHRIGDLGTSALFIDGLGWGLHIVKAMFLVALFR